MTVTCPDCGIPREYKPSLACKLTGFCKVCARKGNRSSQWEGGTVELKCRYCHTPKRSKRNGKIIRLPVHHIDYNRHNLDEHNLVTLCWSCHGKTNANRPYWTTLLKQVVCEHL